MIGSDTLFDSRGCVFGVKLSDEDIRLSRDRGSTSGGHGNQFWD